MAVWEIGAWPSCFAITKVRGRSGMKKSKERKKGKMNDDSLIRLALSACPEKEREERNERNQTK